MHAYRNTKVATAEAAARQVKCKNVACENIEPLNQLNLLYHMIDSTNMCVCVSTRLSISLFVRTHSRVSLTTRTFNLWLCSTTVDGRNPAPVKMADHYLQGYIFSSKISSINSIRHTFAFFLNQCFRWFLQCSMYPGHELRHLLTIRKEKLGVLNHGIPENTHEHSWILVL